MKPTITELPEMKAICFEGYSPDSETNAFNKMKKWLSFIKLERNYRIFGHNIDTNGNLTYDPRNAGYKILLVIDNYEAHPADLQAEKIKKGRFLVCRTEGDINEVGQWLMEGWNKVNKTIQEEHLKVKISPRWYEEHIKTQKSDYVIVDLYLELE